LGLLAWDLSSPMAAVFAAVGGAAKVKSGTGDERGVT
jgi:hypothetical protein